MWISPLILKLIPEIWYAAAAAKYQLAGFRQSLQRFQSLQLLSHYVVALKGTDVDQPCNPAKVVMVEPFSTFNNPLKLGHY